MKINVQSEPVYNLTLTLTEILVLFKLLGDDCNEAWKSFKEEYHLTEKELEVLINTSRNLYDELDDGILYAFGHGIDSFDSERHLVDCYKNMEV